MKSGKPTHFNLAKSYLDCIDDEGNCFIIYWAKLEFFSLAIYYSGMIFSDSDGETIEKSMFKKVPRPQEDEILSFYNNFLKIKGSWKRIDDPISLILYKDSGGNELTWNCNHPKAFAEVVHGSRPFQGFGYAETLSLGINPLNLPVKKLRWGRFLSRKDTVIWICWEGNYTVNRIFCNGTEYNDCFLEDNRIIFNNGASVLLFQEITVIREGKILKVLSEMPFLKIIFNSRLLNSFEIKYKAKSTLTIDSKISSNGWSLYETVKWIR